jgi:putative ABC transport system ATP-binding protein
LKELNAEGQTIVMVTHDERIAAQAGRTIRLLDGKVQE